MRKPLNLILTTLAVVDTLGLTSEAAITIFHSTRDYNKWSSLPPCPSKHDQLIFMLHKYFYLCYISANIWLSVSVAVVRYIVICRNSMSRNVFSMRQSKILVFCVITFSILINVPVSIGVEITSLWSEGDRDCYILGTLLSSSYSKVHQANYWISVFLFVAPCILLSVFTGLLMSTLISAGKKRRQLTSDYDQEQISKTKEETKRVTLMLIALVLTSLVIRLPALILAVINIFSRERLTYYALRGFWLLLILANSSVNILFYSVSRQFRSTLMSLCSRRHGVDLWGSDTSGRTYSTAV